MSLLPLLVVLLVVIGVFMYRHQREKKRTEALQYLARGRGWRFESHPESEPVSLWGKYPLFDRGRGRSRKAGNLVSGTKDEVDFTLFDYSYRSGSGKNSRQHHQSVVFLRCSQFADGTARVFWYSASPK